MTASVVIVGGGVAGLCAARLLAQKGVKDAVLLEARGRVGGRVWTESAGGAPVDLGPSWVWPEHQHTTAAVLKALDLKTFKQYSKGDGVVEDSRGTGRIAGPGGMADASRIVGGTGALTDSLVKTFPESWLRLNTKVTKIVSIPGEGTKPATVRVETESPNGAEVIEARHVIVAVPLRVAAGIDYEPKLEETVKEELLGAETWMAGQAKFFAVYSEPFWRADGLSGDGYSRKGPLGEIHDASPQSGPGALFGFVSLSAAERKARGLEEVKAMAVAQFARLFGPKAAKPDHVFLQDWSTEPLTATARDLSPSGYHPRYGLSRQAASLAASRHVTFASTEASPVNGGFLDGAVYAATHAINNLKTPLA